MNQAEQFRINHGTIVRFDSAGVVLEFVAHPEREFNGHILPADQQIRCWRIAPLHDFGNEHVGVDETGERTHSGVVVVEHPPPGPRPIVTTKEPR